MGWAFIIVINLFGLCILIRNGSKVQQFYNRRYDRIAISVLALLGSYFCYELVYQERLAVKTFFNDYINVFTGIGYLAVVIALIFTAYQIIDSKKKSRARFSYEIRKDLMEFDNTISRDTMKLIDMPDPIPKSAEKETEETIKILLQWYATIYRQRLFGNIDDGEWAALIKSFETFLGKRHVKEYWKKKVTLDKGWTKDFVNLGEKYL